MTKLIYPNDGIYNCCGSEAEQCSSYLSRAISNCNFDIPADFDYKNYLSGLGEKLRGYRTEINEVRSTLKVTDRNFRALSDRSEDNASRLPASKIGKRDRLIK